MKLILGSQSPRRYEILNFFHLPFQQVSPQFDEDAVVFENNPEKYALTLAEGKAHSLIPQFSSSIILTADTVVYKNGIIYGKPKNSEEALQYLRELSGQWHQVWTGLTVYFQERYFYAAEKTDVLFNSLTEEQMQIYHKKLNFADKAGGYMIQGAGSLIVNRIAGCYYNVMGLPINALYKVLLPTGIDLWNSIKG